jgi:hypothetical protein
MAMKSATLILLPILQWSPRNLPQNLCIKNYVLLLDLAMCLASQQMSPPGPHTPHRAPALCVAKQMLQ